MDIHGVSPRLHGDYSPRCVKKCQNRREMSELPINGIVYFHHGDNNIVYTRFNYSASSLKSRIFLFLTDGIK